MNGDPSDIIIQITDIKKTGPSKLSKEYFIRNIFLKLLILSCLLIKFNKKLKNLVLSFL